MTNNTQKIVTATLIAGTLDIGMAITETLLKGKDPLAMLGGLASGPFPGAAGWGLAGSALGLVVHFAIMAVIVAGYPRADATIPAHALEKKSLEQLATWL